MEQQHHTFNKEQERVIRAGGGRHLVLAPPGCGKTAVLAERIVWAHEQQGVSFADMACLTFTNRASRGMRERIYERLPQCEGLSDLFVGNVHRFCSRFLFSQGVAAEGAAVIDTDMAISIIADYLGEDELKVLGEARHRQRYSQVINLQHLLYQCQRNYPGQLMVHRDALSATALRELCTTFGLPYTRQSTIDLYLHADHYRDQHALLSTEGGWLLEALYAARCYERYKRANDLLDFEDLLLLAYDAMAGESDTSGTTPGAAPSYHRYRWIQVDEVQDLNPLQLAIIDLFATDDATMVFLGDAQQAIFSFMGAQTDTLEQLHRQCGPDHFHNFFQNYRSPAYLLNVFNTYGHQQLGISRELLPTTQNHTPQQAGDLVLMDSENNVDEVNLVARTVERLYRDHPDETTAVVVAFNSDADDVSAALAALQVPHFKVSGQDLFATPTVRLLLAHLGVLTTEHHFVSWSQLLAGLRVFSSSSASRQFVRAMMQLGATPADLLDYVDSTYVAEYVNAWETRDLVVFDTETTGLAVDADDVVQIAAVRVQQGQVTGMLNLFVETDRELPAMLGDVVNPLIEEYGRQPHLSHREALQRFARFAEGAVLLGHNATFDYQIMSFQMRRYAPELSMDVLWPRCFDSLKLARLLWPRLASYKLKSLIDTLQLEGCNSHLANDDIMATLSLATACLQRGRERMGAQLEFVSRHRQTAEKLRRHYAALYAEGRRQLFTATTISSLLRSAYTQLLADERVGEEPKLEYLLRYVEHDLLSADSPMLLSDQLHRHMQDLSTMKEADLCGAASIGERVFVSTVHKAKGLEFDNVIVFDAVEGKYPSTFADTRQGGDQEEARKFYVAISRARRRLLVSYCHNSVNRWGRWFSRRLTPYMDCLHHLF